MKPLAAATIAALMLAACAENTGAKQGLGTVMGAVAGGMLFGARVRRRSAR